MGMQTLLGPNAAPGTLSAEEIERNERLRKIARKNRREDLARHRERLAHAASIANESRHGYCEGSAGRWAGDDPLEVAAETASKAQVDGIGVTEVVENEELQELWMATYADQLVYVRFLGRRVAWVKLTPIVGRTKAGYEIAGWRATVPANKARPMLRHVELDGLTPMSLLPPEKWDQVCALTLELTPEGAEPDWVSVELEYDDVSGVFEVRANCLNEMSVHYEMQIDDGAEPALDRTVADAVMQPDLMAAIEANVISECARRGLPVDPSGMW